MKLLKCNFQEGDVRFIQYYDSPLGRILLSADDVGLRGLRFEGQEYFSDSLSPVRMERKTPALAESMRWLDVYFSGMEPDFMPRLRLVGSDFRLSVWKLLLQIPYGRTVSYGEIAKRLVGDHSRARAVGGAVGHNVVPIFIPCHRVVGADGSLTGYAGGVYIKEQLLRLERTGRM